MASARYSLSVKIITCLAPRLMAVIWMISFGYYLLSWRSLHCSKELECSVLLMDPGARLLKTIANVFGFFWFPEFSCCTLNVKAYNHMIFFLSLKSHQNSASLIIIALPSSLIIVIIVNLPPLSSSLPCLPQPPPSCQLSWVFSQPREPQLWLRGLCSGTETKLVIYSW